MNSCIVGQVFLTTAERSLGERLEFAGVNTLLGMGTVFLVLIFISFVISCMKFLPKLLEGGKKTEPQTAVREEIAVPIQVEEPEEIDPSDDLELVAVITAAIQASMGEEVPADGLVVKSIRRINNRKWQNAQ